MKTAATITALLGLLVTACAATSSPPAASSSATSPSASQSPAPSPTFTGPAGKFCNISAEMAAWTLANKDKATTVEDKRDMAAYTAGYLAQLMAALPPGAPANVKAALDTTRTILNRGLLGENDPTWPKQLEDAAKVIGPYSDSVCPT